MSKCCGRPGRGKSRRSRRCCGNTWSVWGRRRHGPKADHPSKIVSLVLDYVTDNAGRMDYPRYRREGLPVTSTIVESLIKQFNQRVKGTEKFWLRGGAEAILQGRAAYLSEDGRGVAFYAHRPRGPAVGRNRLRLIA